MVKLAIAITSITPKKRPVEYPLKFISNKKARTNIASPVYFMANGRFSIVLAINTGGKLSARFEVSVKR